MRSVNDFPNEAFTDTDKISKTEKHGFTLVELLVVLAIIGILVGLLLPALSAARESARRTVCGNNLKNIGIALLSFHETKKRFPPGSTAYHSSFSPNGTQISWNTFVLPQLEQNQLFAEIDFSQPFSSPKNSSAAKNILPVFICPSGERGTQLSEGRGPTDYGGIFGERISGPNNPPKGTMLIGKGVSISQIRDGTSNTLVIGEAADWPDGQWINGRNLFDQAFAIGEGPSFENELSSKHPGVVGTCFADGHVQFLSNDTNKSTLAAICTKSGGEVFAIDN